VENFASVRSGFSSSGRASSSVCRSICMWI
jgi:hypothetical protein